MKRTTVKIPDELDAKLRHEAKRRGMTISDLTREALDAHLGGPPDRPFLRAMAGCFNSGEENLGSRVEEIIKADVKAGRFPS
ncbi:MAG: ribbon-helix-helix domain-containing protein [Actinomycetota bacterium]|nr:ribbon-helix-helix domain-containing protein [Actinomycetota bacterium]